MEELTGKRAKSAQGPYSILMSRSFVAGPVTEYSFLDYRFKSEGQRYSSFLGTQLTNVRIMSS